MLSADTTGILAILDRACDKYAFPMLDNGFTYLAECRSGASHVIVVAGATWSHG